MITIQDLYNFLDNKIAKEAQKIQISIQRFFEGVL